MAFSEGVENWVAARESIVKHLHSFGDWPRRLSIRWTLIDPEDTIKMQPMLFSSPSKFL